MYSYLVLCFVFVCIHALSARSTQCRNEKGEPVDWFYIYKLPKDKNHINPLVRDGVAYMYMTPSTLQDGWKMSDLSVNDTQSMVGQTLSPLYQDKTTFSVLYNDQPPPNNSNRRSRNVLQTVADSRTRRALNKSPEQRRCNKLKLGYKYYDYDLAEMCKIHPKATKTNAEGGHTKGVILGGNNTSLWLVHSVPKFPPIPDSSGSSASNYSYPPTGTRYGQTMLCLSVDTDTVNQIGTQLKYNEPLITYHHIPVEFATKLPNLIDVINNKTVDASPWYHVLGFETLVGRKFLSFAKSAMFKDDLYSGLVAEKLQTDLLVESWTNGPGKLDSDCKRIFKVRNIMQLNFPTANLSFTSHHDHSKWAVGGANKTRKGAHSKPADWICVGDINRALAQESRGGGTVCTSGPLLWGHFSRLVQSVQPCN